MKKPTQTKKRVVRRRSNAPASIGDILARMTAGTPLGKQMDQAQIWEKWVEIAGPTLCAHGQPHAVRDRTLIVEVDSTVWMNRYAYQKWHILQRANRLSGRELISDVFLVLARDAE